MSVCFGSVFLHHVSITIFTQKKLIIDIFSLIFHMYFFFFFKFMTLSLKERNTERSKAADN